MKAAEQIAEKIDNFSVDCSRSLTSANAKNDLSNLSETYSKLADQAQSVEFPSLKELDRLLWSGPKPLLGASDIRMSLRQRG